MSKRKRNKALRGLYRRSFMVNGFPALSTEVYSVSEVIYSEIDGVKRRLYRLSDGTWENSAGLVRIGGEKRFFGANSPLYESFSIVCFGKIA